MTLKDAISRLERLETKLSDLSAFYRQHRPQWLALAQVTTRAVLQSLAPPQVDPAEWTQTVESCVAKVSASLLAGPGSGILIALSDRPPGTRDDDPRFVTDRSIRIPDLLRFIAAGRAGDPDGKRIDYLQDDKSDLQIAWRMLYAARQGRDSFRPHLEKFLGAKATGASVELFSQVLKAWVAVFLPRARRDLATYTRRLLHETLG